MFHKVTCRAVALAACGWLVAFDASALAVGRARGAVLVGRPLELTIPVTLDGKGEDSPCASAEVFYGEERVRSDPTVRWEPGTGGQGVLRVSSPLPVDEPMVTVYLRVGCGQSTTRRIVMLSELPPDNEPGTLPRMANVPAQPSFPTPTPVRPAPAPAPAAAAAANPGAGPGTGGARATGPRRRDAGAADAAVAALRTERALPAAPAGRPAAPAPATRARKPEAVQPRPRLKLEPLELGPERDPVLRLSSELRTEVSTDPQRRAAAAALWKALQKGPDEALQDALRLQSVERELRSLRDITQQNAATVARMREEVERARGQRGIAGGMVAALSLVLLALLAWVGWRWWGDQRLKRVGRWFEEHGEAARATSSRHPAHGLQTQPAPILREGPPAPVLREASPAPARRDAPFGAATAAAAAAGLAAGAAAARSAPAAPAAPAASAPREEFLASRGGITRMVGVQELIDVHDKADFFLSIGEYDQAIALLEAHVHDDVETSALAWMDLLELYHSLGRRAEYERLRNEFRQRFTASVPEFDHFDQPSASLENYGRALSRIVALWPSPRVLDVIEESIFRKPGLPGAEPFSLEAYRELVLLYHVAREMAEEGKGAAATPTFHDTAVHPLNLAERAEPHAERELLMVPPPSVRLGVDIDLGDLPEGKPGGRELPALDFDLDEPTTLPPFDSSRKGP
ncbi:type IV pilus assembly protein FimV [Ramlibacter sp. AN1133]|uniref:type IV pilus assembly protein FimV n=1 Tax=Ramlibacter sp. AN1133 TaxID=3133429 RepID=UPI0030C57E36